MDTAYRRTLAEEATVAGDLGVRTPIVSELRLLAVNRTAATFITESLAATGTQAIPQAELIPDATSADRPVCIEEHSKYATYPSTYGDGSRVPDGSPPRVWG